MKNKPIWRIFFLTNEQYLHTNKLPITYIRMVTVSKTKLMAMMPKDMYIAWCAKYNRPLY